MGTIVESTDLDRRALYALSWNFAQDGKLAVDAVSGSILDANPAQEALTGYSREELIGKHIVELHPEDERDHVMREFNKASDQAASHPGFHIQCKDGSLVPVSIWTSEKTAPGGRSLVIVEFRDISEERDRGHRLATQNWALSAFSIAALALGRAQDSHSLLQSICEAITRESAYVLAWIGIAEGGADKMIRVAASAGSAAAYLDGTEMSWSVDRESGQGPTGVCIRTNTLQILEDARTSPIFGLWRDQAKRFGIQSAVSIPLHLEKGIEGALIVYSARAHAFEAASIEVFQRLAEQIVHGVRALEQKMLLDAERQNLEKTQKQLTDALSASVAAMVTAMEMRDPYTAGHENRVSEIAYAIGKEFGWEEERLQALRMAAMVHDIGKISVPIEILTKPGRLSAEEFSLVKGHAESSYQILKDIPFTWPIADMVRQHHEKLDGSGYPLGLMGDAILPESKVLTVADIVEAMASNRPYRAAIDLDVALAEIQRQAGTLLDPEVVRICVALFRQQRLHI
jgi:PAS domain S-box-containing protein